MNSLAQLSRRIFRYLPISPSTKEKLKRRIIGWFPFLSTAAARPSATRDPDRRSKLLKVIKDLPNLDGLEIGALDKPLITKAESNGRIMYVDIASAAELKDFWKGDPGVSLDEIVETDFICAEQSLTDVIGGNKIDYVIASHIAEHVPDMVGWLNDMEDVLHDHGILSLAIPDKRYTFDFLRDLTTPGMIFEAYLLHRKRPSPREVFDCAYMVRHVDGGDIYDGTVDIGNLSPFTDLEGAFGLAKYSLDHYKDTHVHVFTPKSYLDLMEVISRLDLIDLAIVDFSYTANRTIEFFVSYERLPRNLTREEMRLLQLSSLERARKSLPGS